MVINGQHYRDDLILTEGSVVDSWWRIRGHSLCLEDLQPVLEDPPEVLVVGQGDPGLMEVPEELADALRARGIEVMAAPTREAVRLFNSLAGRRKTAGAFHLTC